MDKTKCHFSYIEALTTLDFTDMGKAACRSRVTGDVVIRYLAIAHAVSSVLQLLWNLIAVPNGDVYAN